MNMTISAWLERKIENGSIKEDQIIACYNDKHNLEYLGKAGFAPVALWWEFKRAELIGNELRINY